MSEPAEEFLILPSLQPGPVGLEGLVDQEDPGRGKISFQSLKITQHRRDFSPDTHRETGGSVQSWRSRRAKSYCSIGSKCH